MSGGSDVLARILARTRECIQERRRKLPVDKMRFTGATPGLRRSFEAAVSRPGQVNVIAEFKRRSPSRGVIREDLHPVKAAQAYEVAGAAALSVLTEEQFFGGSLEDLKEARGATLLPTLRKDFIVDPYQVWETWHAGADALLLIVAALDDRALRDLLAASREVALPALVEVHDQDELERALRAGARIVGVNSRNLRTMEVNLQTALDLAPRVPDDVVAVAESGIRGAGDLRRLREAGYDAFLVGEHLMQEADPGAALEEMIKQSSIPRWEGRAARRGRVAVKICGITSVEDGLVAAQAGADAVGFVFWSGSPRRVDVAAARRIARALPPFVLRVGVFVDAPRAEMARAVEEVGLDLLQLHGREPPESLADLPRRAIKAVGVGEDFAPEDALRYEGRAAGILLDTRGDGGRPGGTGQTFDWTRVRAVREKASFLMLAGGLNPGNVHLALTAVRPDGVDVSSGVEAAPGRKDPEKVRAFVAAVREAER
jgi:indole-3-glycerol phosphate synthase / phosphoribosylanthranilate isomerase